MASKIIKIKISNASKMQIQTFIIEIIKPTKPISIKAKPIYNIVFIIINITTYSLMCQLLLQSLVFLKILIKSILI